MPKEKTMDDASPPAGDRRFMFSRIPRLSSWPQAADGPGEPFCLLLLFGDEVPEVTELESFTPRAAAQGMVSLSVWGSASAWIEEVIDEICVAATLSQSVRPSLLTTAHSDLQEAVRYFEEDVRPPLAVGHCKLWWTVAIGDSDPGDLALHALEARHPVERLEQ